MCVCGVRVCVVYVCDMMMMKVKKLSCFGGREEKGAHDGNGGCMEVESG